MIATRTPFRVTLGGGGTDLPRFYEKHGGFILAMGIDKYMYVVVNVPNADRLVRLHYTSSETVERVDQLRHGLAREALRAHGISDAIEIASLADLPAGTGLGSSSCYLVGLLNAIRAYLSRPVPLEELAEEACRIEMEVLQRPIGKQDPYLAALGGLTELEIERSGRVRVRRLNLAPHLLADLVANMHLYYTNRQRDATDILEEMNRAMAQGGGGAVEKSLLKIRDTGYAIAEAIRASEFDRFGRLLHEHWMAKQRLSDKVSLSEVDRLYDHLREEYGVLGGKVAGAGGGGFLMLYCPSGHRRLMDFMGRQGMSRLSYTVEQEGSRVVAHVLKSSALHHHRSG